MAIITPLDLTSRTFLLVVLVFLLVDGRNLVSERSLLPTRCVNKGGVDRLIFSKVFFLLLCGSVLSGEPWVYIAGIGALPLPLY